MSQQVSLSLAFALGGLFACIGAGLDLDFFMNHRKAQFIVRMLGRGGARIFYMIIGLVFLGVGIGFYTGAIPLQGAPSIR